MKSLRESRIAIVGLGLMGGSLALALQRRGACHDVAGVDISPSTLEEARALGIAARADLESVSQADVVALALPVREIVEQLPRIGALARQGAVVLDLGSTKRDIVQAMEQLPHHLQPIGGHPMCGREVAGFTAADPNLFDNALFVLTPLERTTSEAVSLAEELVQAVGARPLVMDPARHDRVVAATSHLPYALAMALVSLASDMATQEPLLFSLVASGFRDTTRLAASDTTVMLDTLLTNKDNVANMIRQYSGHLNRLANLISERDELGLRKMLENAARKRRELTR